MELWGLPSRKCVCSSPSGTDKALRRTVMNSAGCSPACHKSKSFAHALRIVPQSPFIRSSWRRRSVHWSRPCVWGHQPEGLSVISYILYETSVCSQSAVCRRLEYRVWWYSMTIKPPLPTKLFWVWFRGVTEHFLHWWVVTLLLKCAICTQ